MGDGGRRGIKSQSARDILSARVRDVASASPFPFASEGRETRQRGQKPFGAQTYSIAVTLRRLRI